MKINQFVLVIQLSFLWISGYSCDLSEQIFYKELFEQANILNEDQFYQDTDVCQTNTCETAGKVLKSNLNVSVDPCDDFYEFACGGWMSTHTIPEDKSRFFGDDGLEDIINKKIKNSLSQTNGSNHSKAVVFASELYKSCIDSVSRESVGVTPLIKAVDSVGGWPLSPKSGSFDEKNYDWRQSLPLMIAELGYNPVFSIGVSPDANDTKINRFYFGAAELGLGRNQLLNQSQYPEIVSAYKHFILESALLLGAKNDSHTHQQIEEIVAFETKLANETLAEEESGSSDKWYNRMTFLAFNHLTENRVDWVNLTNTVYAKLSSNVRVNPTELTIVSDIDYFKVITKLMEKTPKRVIANYFGWVAVSSYGPLTNQAFRSAAFKYSQVLTGAIKDTELWEDCVSEVSEMLEYAVSRLYIETSFTPTDKQVASVMVNDIKQSFDDLIKVSDWLDTETRDRALKKLDAIHQNVGYPDWILNNTQLDKYYNLTKTADPKMYFQNMLFLQQRAVLNAFNAVREAVNLNTSWPMPPHIVNAAYDPTQNSITIPAGQLTPPYFDIRLPAYVNYGAIGAVVGHELTHGFDDQGSQFDADGNLINWWTENVYNKFSQREDCFILEYSSYLDSQSKLKLNGNNTVGENIADNGGIRESYKAYEKYVQTHGKQQRLPHISQYTADQQFFISYANTWCTKYRTEYLKEMIQYNPHSPAKYRVNLPLANFKTFSEVYKCSAQSKMNRKDKCVLW